MGIEEDRFGRKKRSLEELKRLLNDLKNERKDWSDRIDRLVKALEAENLKVSQDISTSLKNMLMKYLGIAEERVCQIGSRLFKVSSSSIGMHVETMTPFNWVKIGKQ